VGNVNEKNATIDRIDIEALETAGDGLIREGHTQTALTLYALALRLRAETRIHPLRRATDD